MTWGEFLLIHSIEWIVLLILLVCSAFFSGTETAMLNLSRSQLQKYRRSAHRIPQLIVSILKRPRSMLNTVLLGNMLVNVAFTTIAVVTVYSLEHVGAAGWVLVVASLVPMLVLLLFGEVLPKVFAYLLRERWAWVMAVPLSLVLRGLAPLVWVLEKLLVLPLTKIVMPRPGQPPDITLEEMEAMLDLSAKRGLIDDEASDLLQEVIQLKELHVRDVMVPRVDVIAHNIDAPPEKLADLFRHTHLRKIPVYRNDMDHVLGVVHAKDFFLNKDTSLE